MRERHLEVLIYCVLFFLLCGFFQLQVVKGNAFREMSESNRIRTIPLISARGRIYDRNGIILAENKPILNLSLIPDDFNFQYTEKIAEILDLNAVTLKEELKKRVFSGAGDEPFLVQRDISMTVVYRLEELSTLMGGVIISRDSLRHYPEENLASHIVGYIGKINQNEYNENKQKGWLFNDSIGRTGVEKTFNNILMGVPGGKQLEVDAKGRELRILSEKDPIIGKDVHLSIDVRFQERILNLLDHDQNTAVCVLDIKTGEVVALVSTPAFDPNVFVNPSYSDRRMPLLTDGRHPIINRTIGLLYSPGSVFKVLIGLAALQEGAITAETTFVCDGEYQMNERSRPFRCWKEDGHGPVSLLDAVKQSCNIYFYRTGLRLGSQKIAKYARMFGFGESVNLGLPYAKSGVVPDALWKLKRFKERWYPGETLNYAIGQGFLLVTPLQIARLMVAIANNGKVIEPSVVKGGNKESEQIPVDRENFKMMQRCMLAAIESDLGTAQLARPALLRMAGKTGTAQTFGEPHSWYAGFFPYQKPRIAIVVLVEHGGPGGGTAAVYAGTIADEWLLYTTKKERKTPKSFEELGGN